MAGDKLMSLQMQVGNTFFSKMFPILFHCNIMRSVKLQTSSIHVLRLNFFDCRFGKMLTNCRISSAISANGRIHFYFYSMIFTHQKYESRVRVVPIMPDVSFATGRMT